MVNLDDTGSFGQVNETYEEDIETQDFDDLIFALKTGGHFDPDEDEKPPFPDRQEHFELRRISIPDTHLWVMYGWVSRHESKCLAILAKKTKFNYRNNVTWQRRFSDRETHWWTNCYRTLDVWSRSNMSITIMRTEMRISLQTCCHMKY